MPAKRIETPFTPPQADGVIKHIKILLFKTNGYTERVKKPRLLGGAFKYKIVFM